MSYIKNNHGVEIGYFHFFIMLWLLIFFLICSFLIFIVIVSVDGDDEIIYRYLERVSLDRLCKRLGGLDVQVDWNW